MKCPSSVLACDIMKAACGSVRTPAFVAALDLVAALQLQQATLSPTSWVSLRHVERMHPAVSQCLIKDFLLLKNISGVLLGFFTNLVLMRGSVSEPSEAYYEEHQSSRQHLHAVCCMWSQASSVQTHKPGKPATVPACLTR